MFDADFDEIRDDLIWVEKYRPKTVDDCILPERLKSDFKNFVKNKKFPNLLLTGGPGTGKTTIAKAMCKDLGYSVRLINASDERNLEVVRTTIKEFASTTSLSGNKKAIILDEADGLTPDTQSALRAAMEQYSNVAFILTCNYKNKLIPAIRSRTTSIEFNILKEEKKDMMLVFLKRVFEILQQENVEFDKKVVAEIVKKFYPDNRRILNDLQRYSSSGKIDIGVLTHIQNNSISGFVGAVKELDFGALRQWIANNSDIDPSLFFREVYDTMYPIVSPSTIGNLVMITSDYQYKAVIVPDQEINMAAYGTELMNQLQFEQE